MPDSPHVNRRRFLRTSVASTTAIFATPCFVRASDKAGTKAPIVGGGEYTYECIHNFDRAHLPAEHHFGNASHGVAVDEQGLVYITHQGQPGSIFVFDTDGKFVRAMGEIHAGMGHGIDIRKEGSEEFLYLSPSNSKLFFAKLTLGGETVWKRGKAELDKDSGGVLEAAKRYRPTNTSFRPDGGYYLGDGYGSSCLFEYDRHDKFVRVLGGKGTADGKFNTPHGQWLDDRDGTPRLVVADRANKRLQWFNMDGSHERTLGGFLLPADIDVRGDLMLVPDLHTRVTILNQANEVVAQLGEDEQWRTKVLATKGMRNLTDHWPSGLFVHPHDACFDHDGNIYVVEWVNTGRVTKLVRQV